MERDTNVPPAMNGSSIDPPSIVYTIYTTSHQSTSIKLLEVELLQP